MNIRSFEIIAALLTGVSKLVFVDLLDAKFWFILIALIFWVAYILFNFINEKHRFRDWGFRIDGFKSTFRILAIPAIIVLVGSVVYGILSDKIIIHWHIIPIIILYPIWGVIQQFIVLSLFGNNLLEMSVVKSRIFAISLVTAFLFGIIHYPSWPLVAATFGLALVYFRIFIKEKNLWALGLFHGWLGAIFYFFVLGRDPWLEIFQSN